MKNDLLEIKTIVDEENGNLTIKGGYDNALSTLNLILENYKTPLILTDEDKKVAKEKRADLNSLLKTIKNERISCVALYTGRFENEVKALEKLIDARQKEFGKAIEDYESVDKVVITNPKITATITCNSEAQFNELVEFCKVKGIEIKTK